MFISIDLIKYSNMASSAFCFLFRNQANLGFCLSPFYPVSFCFPEDDSAKVLQKQLRSIVVLLIKKKIWLWLQVHAEPVWILTKRKLDWLKKIKWIYTLNL